MSLPVSSGLPSGLPMRRVSAVRWYAIATCGAPGCWGWPGITTTVAFGAPDETWLDCTTVLLTRRGAPGAVVASSGGAAPPKPAAGVPGAGCARTATSGAAARAAGRACAAGCGAAAGGFFLPASSLGWLGSRSR